MERNLRVGLTGGIASGKTTVAGYFKEFGVTVIDADEIARFVVAPGQPALLQIIAKFGTGALLPDGELDRRKLRNQVFAEPELRKALEIILHPMIRKEMERRSNAAPGPYVILAIPLLVESRDPARVDRILVVDVEEKLQLQRLVERDAETLEQARSIVGAQASRSVRLKAADDVLLNNGSIAQLRKAVEALHERYLLLANADRPEKPI